MMKITTEDIAYAIAKTVLSGLAYHDFDTLAEALRRNSEEGWTIERSSEMPGNWIVISEISVSEDIVRRAHEMAYDLI